ncbi:MAG: tetratricopeptide repeat protein, partial [Candidatus Latescibacterota bacterium]
GEYGKAAQVLEEALRVAPPRPDIYFELIRLYMAQRAFGRADSLYHRALSQFPDDSYLHTLHDEIVH